MAEGTEPRPISFDNFISDLNEPFSRNSGMYLDQYLYTATNKPGPNDGFVITQVRNANAIQQVAFDIAGNIARRYLYNGTISEWKTITPQ